MEHSLEMWFIKLDTVFHLCYRTNITNLEFIMKDVESRWIQLPEDVRSAYGQKYIEKYQVRAFVSTVMKFRVP